MGWCVIRLDTDYESYLVIENNHGLSRFTFPITFTAITQQFGLEVDDNLVVMDEYGVCVDVEGQKLRVNYDIDHTNLTISGTASLDLPLTSRVWKSLSPSSPPMKTTETTTPTYNLQNQSSPSTPTSKSTTPLWNKWNSFPQQCSPPLSESNPSDPQQTLTNVYSDDVKQTGFDYLREGTIPSKYEGKCLWKNRKVFCQNMKKRYKLTEGDLFMVRRDGTDGRQTKQPTFVRRRKRISLPVVLCGPLHEIFVVSCCTRQRIDYHM
jgi:hypothetical protein